MSKPVSPSQEPAKNPFVPAVALDGARRPGALALRTARGDLARKLDEARAHASDLPLALERLLAEQALEPRALRAVVVGIGPGSFTGLRVAAAFALGLARGTGAVLKAVPNAEAACLALLADDETALWAHDLRSGGIALARCARHGGALETVEPASARSVDAARAAAAAAELLVCDAPARDALGVAPTDPRWRDSASAAIELALLELGLRALERDGPDPTSAIEPLYLRPFGAPAV
jgi:tRNA threonylcarbamoyladenosine biosynthesis protein TsaB